MLRRLLHFCHRRGTLLLAVVVFLWHIYDLQQFDQWATELLQGQYDRGHRPWDSHVLLREQLQPTIILPPSEPLRYFSNPENLDKLISLGPHFLTTVSGCRMARWVYPTTTRKNRYRDCQGAPKDKMLVPRHRTFDYLRPFDTIYVTIQKLPSFVETVLPFLQTDVVIMSGQVYKMPSLEDSVVHRLIHHPRIVRWFCQNLDIHVQPQRHNSSKVSPFPYGLKETTHKHHATDQEALQAYRDVFFRSLRSSRRPRVRSEQPSCKIFVGYLHPWPERVSKKIPGTDALALPQLKPVDYYQQLSRHDFVLSPNGDRPECYRHYEALGLGVIPITELDRAYYGHLQDGPVIYETTDWNITHLEGFCCKWNVEQRRGLSLGGTVRNMILEEYWMEYVEGQVGMSLQWWDRERNCSTTLRELTVKIANGQQ
ncbi:hypothetical protein IV203_025814 [Nitzschia inconspicua]|uniref:RXYLT1 C-terminal domain-containing protein n=1 Tax=Nitzschia inconspicua TaxID=303405 RepID=A0A9K3LIC0_9STRA|nr:hypothetical protein IV203_017661 [Nitzschia inconspicua]KAG7362148.1 hypothetical protein IV203_025814 [Nitzschia inconspicua]